MNKDLCEYLKKILSHNDILDAADRNNMSVSTIYNLLNRKSGQTSRNEELINFLLLRGSLNFMELLRMRKKFGFTTKLPEDNS